MSLTAPLTWSLHVLKDYAASIGWEPLVHFSKSAILTLLKGIETGRLDIAHEDGQVSLFGQPRPTEGAPRAALQVHKDSFWVRMLLFADMVSQVTRNKRCNDGALKCSRRDLLKVSCSRKCPVQT
jgi:hypothetical protein